MAEEDLIFGKNRHFFGGIEPSNMITFEAVSNYDVSTQKPKIRITAELPKDTVIEGQTLCTVAGAVIRRSTTDYPKDEFSGDLVADITANGNIVDEDVVLGTTYYYAAFPYTKQGVYNRNPANHASAEAATYLYLYGYDLVKATQGQDERVTYPSDVDNKDFEPAYMDFAESVFHYGSWPSTPGEKFMPRPCMLAFNGTVQEYLDPDDYTKTSDGQTSHVTDDGYGGNAMMEWPKIYVKRWFSDGVYHFRCSDIPVDENYDCWSNYDKNNNPIEHFYTPIYFGSSISGRLRSLSGKSNYVNNNAQSEINLAKANGEGWYTEFLADRLLIQDLLVMMAKSTDTQGKYGYGRCRTGNTSAIGQGTMNTKGLFWGDDDQTSGVKVFGMENWWGNIWRRIAGWINANGTQKIKVTWGTHDGSEATEFNLDGTGYLDVDGATPGGTSGGYINNTVDLKFGRIPCTASGSATTFEGDGMWFNTTQVNYAFVGGSWTNALSVGAFCVTLNNLASDANASIGAALSCKPLAQ